MYTHALHRSPIQSNHPSAMATAVANPHPPGRRIFTHLLFLFLIFSISIQHAGAQANADPLGSNRFNPSMKVIIVVLVAALFFMGFFSIYIRQCSEGSVNGAVRPLNGIAVGRSRRAARGLDPAVIETFPTLLYSAVKGLKVGKEALECAVCLNEFEDDETLRLIPKCDHVFHPDCIDAWLVSHTTCPVCRANLVPDPGESTAEPSIADLDLESQNDVSFNETENHNRNGELLLLQPVEPEVMNPNATFNRNRTRRSRSGRPRKFPRSHSTGHSLIQPGEDTERFTLRLPVEVRKQILNRKLNRATSLVVLPREGSLRRGYRTGGEGSSRGKGSRRLDRSVKSDRWLFNMTPPFFMRALSFQLRSPKPVGKDQENMAQPLEPGEQFGDSARPPV